MASNTHNDVRFQQLASSRSTPRSSFDSASGPHDEAFALLSDAESVSSDGIELGNINSMDDGPTSSTSEDSRPANSRSEALRREAFEAEHSLKPRDAIRAYPMAVFWSLVVSLCVIMEGYDTILIGSFFAHPEFTKKFGEQKDAQGHDQLSALWQAILGNSSTIGCILGVLANGLLVERFGQKIALVGSLFVLAGCIFITFFAVNRVMLMLGQIACGLPWGVFASSAPAYASEVLPLTLRVYLTTWTNMCFIIGQLIAAGILAGLIPLRDQWSFRIPFALQWAWPVVLIPLLVFAPESPWHLVRKGRVDEAEASLSRLQRRKVNNLDVKYRLKEIQDTNDLEEKHQTGTSYWDCFRGVELRRTEIACMAFAAQVLSGSNFAYNSVYFFQQVGLQTQDTYNLNIGGTALALAGTFFNWFALMPRFGRRRIFLWGMFTMSVILFVIGVLDEFTYSSSTLSKAIGWAQAALTLVWTFIFQLSVGQLGWAIPSEVGSTRLRQKTICIARFAYYVMNLLASTIQPYFINPNSLNLKGKTGFIWGSTAFCTFVWAFFRLPETKGRSYQELDYLFHRKIPTRLFETVDIDVLDEDQEKLVVQPSH
ncbi:Maltose permease MAL31-like protein 1 [Colletotrichum chlorophyti]|uniref:Maltose permease MAL31-like protein 1 n=1 Tax=Colletotrichum chlorophyti TaxID=708187 RepID=A0A1Q8RUS7_9PEZI|nr:Maltose permease MAL31-like protein 1 [Colletotrichum chlorophyti]